METELNVHIGSDFGNKKSQIIHNLSILLNGLDYEQLDELEGSDIAGSNGEIIKW